MTESFQDDFFWMHEALVCAEQAEALGEVPVGAVLVFEGAVLGKGWNAPIGTCDPTAHAEIHALRAAGKMLGNYRLPGTTLYVTLEPCLMCVGAILHARVDRLVFGADDAKLGVVRTGAILAMSSLNHTLKWQGGVLADLCAERLRHFFRKRRY